MRVETLYRWKVKVPDARKYLFTGSASFVNVSRNFVAGFVKQSNIRQLRSEFPNQNIQFVESATYFANDNIYNEFNFS